MKVRWTTGSVRFRITPSEMELLRDHRVASVELMVLGDAWRATIIPTKSSTDLSLCCGNLKLSLAFDDIDRLADPSTEGVYFRTKGQISVRYFVEKDFPCIHPKPEEVEETSTETFAAPQGFALRHARC